MRNISVVVNGMSHEVQIDDAPAPRHSVNARDESHVIKSSVSEVDQIAALLGQVIRRAQGLGETDRTRVRAFVSATAGMLTATTYLPESDQKIFDESLRDVAARKFGV